MRLSRDIHMVDSGAGKARRRANVSAPRAVASGLVLLALVLAASASARQLASRNDPSKITATCFASDSDTGSFSPTNPVVLWSGSDLVLRLGYRNDDDGASAVYAANFTTTISATTAFGAARTIDTAKEFGGDGLKTGIVKGVKIPSLAPATEQVTIEVTSDATGSTVLASCSFQVTVKPMTTDIDGDGISNTLEQTGLLDSSGNLVKDADGDPAADFPSLDANPCRKDLFIEADYQGAAADGHDHKPSQAALDEVAAAFDAAPIPAVPGGCPFAGYESKGGVHLRVLVDDALAAETTSTDSKGNTVVNGVNCGNRTLDRFDPARRPYFLYSIWVHTLRGDSTSGEGPCADGRSFMISLGQGWTGANGSAREQSGTFMHELGHVLGLGHGGDSGVNLKPNYLSVMSYAFQLGIPTSSGSRIDYSRSALAELDEAALNESAGIGGAAGLQTKWWGPQPKYFYSSTSSPSKPADGPLDWNQNGSIDSGTVSVDVNSDGACVGPGDNKLRDTPPRGDDVVVGAQIWNGGNRACDTRPTGDDVQLADAMTPCVVPGANGTLDTTPAQDDQIGTYFTFKWVAAGANRICDTTAAGDDFQFAFVGRTEPRLTGFDDWAAIDWRIGPARVAPSPGVTLPPVQPHADLTAEQAKAMALAAGPSVDFDLDTWVTVNETDPTPADVLTFTYRVENVGTGLATGISVTATKPDGTTQTQPIVDLAPGAGVSFQGTYTVPANAPDRTTVKLTATATGKNLFGDPERVVANNTRSATATVRVPVVTLAKTAPLTAVAGDGLIYTLVYANTGSGSARSAALSDTLPRGISYSTALDAGPGPKPTTVTVNSDGTTTLTWTPVTIAPSSGPLQIGFTARVGLLTGPGALVNRATLTFTDKNGNVYAPRSAEASTSVSAVVPTRDPQGVGFWKSHPELLVPEVLARVQATDGRFDGAGGGSPDGVLSLSEAASVLGSPTGPSADVLRAQLLGTYLNLATRRIATATAIASRTASRVGVGAVGGAVAYATATLALPADANRDRYSDAIRLLDEINANKSETAALAQAGRTAAPKSATKGGKR